MLFKTDKYFYKRNFELCLITSLLLIIILFYFFPEIRPNKTEIIQTNVPIISADDIPNTIQLPAEGLRSAKPKVPSIFIPDNIEIDEILDNVKVGNNNYTSSFNKSKNKRNQMEEKLFVPKQILEVVPEKNDGDFSGIVDLSLKIGQDGKVIEHRVLSNTTNSEKCLKMVISAAYNSRWEPVVIGGEKREFWIEKSYSFSK
jgi:hypothetical protein